MNNMQNDKMLKHPNTMRENKTTLHNRNLRIINNSSSNNSTSNNFFQLKKLKIKKNDKSQKTNLELVKKNIFMKLKNNLKKYDSSVRKLNIKTINDIIYDERKHIVSVFKDYLFWDENSDFLKRFYKMNESRERMPRISAYYQTYTLIRPIYFKLECYRLLSKNLKRQKKRLEILEEKLSNNNNNKHKNLNESNNGDESKRKNKNKSDEFSKIVKSQYIQTENLTEINSHNVKENNERDLFIDIENKNLNNFLMENKIGDGDLIIFGDNKNGLNSETANELGKYKSIGIKRMIKLKDVGNKYDIENFHLEENKKANFDNETNEKDGMVSNNKINNSFSFLELHNLLDKKGSKIDRGFDTNHNKNPDKDLLVNKKNIIIIKNIPNVKSYSNSNKRLKINPSNYNNANYKNKILTAAEKNKAKINLKNTNSNKIDYVFNKYEEPEINQHSLFWDDYSIIHSEDKEIKSELMSSHHYINLPMNGEQSFFTANQTENSMVSRNNENKTDITLDSNVETKQTQSGKENLLKLNSKENEKGVGNKLIINHNHNNIILKQQQSIKEPKKINIPTLNLQNINLINNQNTLITKTEKKQSDPKFIKKQQTLESRKLSEPIKNDNKNVLNNNSNTILINHNNNKAVNDLMQSSKNILPTNNNKKDHHVKYENDKNHNLSNSKSDREIETKTNQNFKIIENMIKSIKMNNIDGLMNIINSKSKTKNKALTSREKDRGDILILQNIYSRNLNKNKLNEEKRASSNTNDRKTLSDKYRSSNNVEKSKINEHCDKDKIYSNLLDKLKNEDSHRDEIDCDDVYNKMEIKTITEPNVTEGDIKDKKHNSNKNNQKKIVIKNSSNYRNNIVGNSSNSNNNFFSSRNSKDAKKKEMIQNKDVMTDLNIKEHMNNDNKNRNLISSVTNRNNNTNINSHLIVNNNNNSNKILSNNNIKNNHNNPSSVYNINLNLNLNLNLKMDKLKSSEMNETPNEISKKPKETHPLNKNPNSRNISASNHFNNNQVINSSRNNLNKQNRIFINKPTEESLYKNLINPKQQGEFLVLEPSSLTDRHNKDYFNIDELKIKSNLIDKGYESNYINTEDNNVKNYQKQFEKINFVNKFSSKVTEKNAVSANLNNFHNNLIISNNLQSKLNIPHNLSRNVYNTNNLKLKIKAEEENTAGSNNATGNLKNFTNNINSINSNNSNSYFTKKIIEEEKKSRNVQNNNLADANLFMNQNINNNNHVGNNNLNLNNINNNSNNSNSNNEKFKNTLSSKLRITQPLTHRIFEGVNKNFNNINNPTQSDDTKQLNLEKKINYKSEKNRITNPLLNLNANKQFNSNSSSNNNNNISKNLINNINPKLPSSTRNGNSNNNNNLSSKIIINNLVKNANYNYNSEKGSTVKNFSEKETKNNFNTNSNLFSSIDVNNFTNNNNNFITKGENKKQNYESINSNQNINLNHDATSKSPNLINDESYLRIIQNTEKKFNSISRNFNLKNLILFNDTTNINKNSNPISLKQTETYAKNNYSNNTARNNSASNNFYFENYLLHNKNENSTLQTKDNVKNENKLNYISLEKSKFNDLNSRNFETNDIQDRRGNIASQQKSVISTYNDRHSPFSNEKNQTKIQKLKSNNSNNNNNNSDKKNEDKNESENYSLLNNLNEINLFASGDFCNKNKIEANNDKIMNYADNNKQKIKIPILNLKDINKNVNEEYQEIEPKGNLTSTRNNKNTINDFLKKNINIAMNSKEYLTSRNEKNTNVNKIDLVNVDSNPKKVHKDNTNQGAFSGDNKNAFLKNNLKMVLDAKNKSNTYSNQNFVNNFNLKK